MTALLLQVDEKALEALRPSHPLPGVLLSYRKLHKLATGFITPLATASVRPKPIPRSVSSSAYKRRRHINALGDAEDEAAGIWDEPSSSSSASSQPLVERLHSQL